MTSSLFRTFHTFFEYIWQLFTCFVVPGTHATPGEIAVFAVILVLTIRNLRMTFTPKHDGGDDE